MNEQQRRNKPVRKRRTINWQRILLVATFILYMCAQLFINLQDTKQSDGVINLDEIYAMAADDKIDTVNVTRNSTTMKVNLKDGRVLDAVNPQNDTFIRDLMQNGIHVIVQKTSITDALAALLVSAPIAVIMLLVISYLMNTVIGGSTKMFTLLKKSENHTTFDDIQGMGKTKKEVRYIIEQLQNWCELGALGARPLKGVLLYGPPGTGKTMLAKAIAKESNVAFISASGSDFNEVFVGVGAARVRSLWNLAISNAPCILFIDEIDCLGKRRKGGDGASNDHNQTLNALLQKLDGLNQGNGVMIIGATNRKDDLDSALLRPGRFDRQIYVGPPDNKKDRDEIVELYLKNKKLDSEVNTETASKLMVGLTGAEIEECLNSAVYKSLQDQRGGIIKLKDIDEAVMELHVGGIKVDDITDHDLEITAIHESGHALVSLLLGLPVSKVSVIPYTSGVGGVTLRDMDVVGDNKLKLKKDYENDIKVYLAGKCAEEIKFDEHSQGCSNDLEKATETIYSMLTAFGMDTKSLINPNILIANGVSKSVNRDIIDKCNSELYRYSAETLKMLSDNKDLLYKLANKLMEERTIVNVTLEKIKEY